MKEGRTMTRHEVKSFNGLSSAEAERLALLLEECGEVQQAIGKILRHGYESCHPTEGGPTNRESLEKELGDVQYAVSLMASYADIRSTCVDDAAVEKARMVKKYLHHNS